MENNEETTFVEDRHYKIQCGRTYYVRKKTFTKDDGTTFSAYYIPVQKINGNTKFNFRKLVRFKKGIEIKDNTKILINNMFEDVKSNPKDEYNPIWNLMITEFDIVEEPDDLNEAIKDYQNNLDNTKIDNERENSEEPLF